jgi:hypothetical protein
MTADRHDIYTLLSSCVGGTENGISVYPLRRSRVAPKQEHNIGVPRGYLLCGYLTEARRRLSSIDASSLIQVVPHHILTARNQEAVTQWHCNDRPLAVHFSERVQHLPHSAIDPVPELDQIPRLGDVADHRPHHGQHRRQGLFTACTIGDKTGDLQPEVL